MNFSTKVVLLPPLKSQRALVMMDFSKQAGAPQEDRDLNIWGRMLVLLTMTILLGSCLFQYESLNIRVITSHVMKSFAILSGVRWKLK